MKSKTPLLLLGLSITYQAQAGGLYLHEIATEDLGLAGAGIAARAQDASTVYSNPAGMTLLDGDQSTLGLQAFYGDVDYVLDGRGSIPGNSPGNVIGWVPGISSFFSHSINDDLKIGLATYGNYGSGIHFDDWAGQKLITDSTLLVITFQPTIAYRLNDNWSVGAGLGINYGYFSLKRNASYGESKLTDADWSFHTRLGIMYEMDANTRFGLAYSSAADIDVNVNTQVNIDPPIPGNQSVLLNVPIAGQTIAPQNLMFSAYHKLNDKWAILGNVGWENWGKYSDSKIFVVNRELPSKDRVRDTWHLALGTQYQMTPQFRVNTGIAYDSSLFKSSQDTSLTLPSGKAWRFGLGGQYDLNKKSSFGAAVEYLGVSDGHVASPQFSGDYRNKSLYFFSVNYSHKF